MTRALGEPLRDALGGVGQERDDHLVGDRHHHVGVLGRGRALRALARLLRERRAVVLREEGGDHLLVGHLGVLHRERRDVGELAAPDVEERELDEIPSRWSPRTSRSMSSIDTTRCSSRTLSIAES